MNYDYIKCPLKNEIWESVCLYNNIISYYNSFKREMCRKIIRISLI